MQSSPAFPLGMSSFANRRFSQAGVDMAPEPIMVRRMTATGAMQIVAPPVVGGKPKPISAEEESFRVLCVDASQCQTIKDYDTAIEKFEQALALDVTNPEMLSFALGSAGICAFAAGHMDKSVQFHESHVQLAQRHSDRSMECKAQCNRGLSLTSLGRYEEALVALESARRLATLDRDDLARMRAFANAGNVYSAMGDFEKAIENHEQQLRLAVLLGDAEAEARASHNLQNDHNSLAKYQQARGFYSAKEAVYTAKGDEAVILGNFGTNPAHEDLRAGWVIKHKGGYNDAPGKIVETKRLLVIEGSIVAYYNDTKSKTASRYIPLADIVAVEKWGGRTADKNFKIRTAKRTFWFTCDTAEECRAWIGALSEELPMPDGVQVVGDGSLDFSRFKSVPGQYETLAFKTAITLPGVDEERTQENPLFLYDTIPGHEGDGSWEMYATVALSYNHI